MLYIRTSHTQTFLKFMNLKQLNVIGWTFRFFESPVAKCLLQIFNMLQFKTNILVRTKKSQGNIKRK